MAKKAQKRSTTKKAATKPPKAARKSAMTATAKAKSPAPAKRTIPPSRPAPADPTLGEQAERLRDDILRSKLTHPDPWRYAPKARAWGDRVQILVVQTAESETPATRRALEALAAEVLADRDFQEARRLF